MVSDYIFLTLLFIIINIFLFRKTIYVKLHKDYNFINISIETFNIIIIIMFFLVNILFTIDLLNTNDTRYKDISANFDNLKVPDEQKRPHPMFDINTYKDSHEWGN